GGAPTTQPILTRTDTRIDFPWGDGSPMPGVINTDWFYARWTGYFVPATSGSYTFGGINDDNMKIWINGTEVYNFACYYATGACYDNNNAVTLTANQPVSIRVEYQEATATASAKLFYKLGGGASNIVEADKLQTGSRPVGTPHGLRGSYFPDDGSHVFPGANKLFLSRTDPVISFNWGSGGVVPGAQ